MQKKEVCLGMIGAGRATELHMNAIHRYSGVPVRCKTIVARRWEQVVEAKNKYGFETATLNVKELLEDPEIDVIDICTPPSCFNTTFPLAIPSPDCISYSIVSAFTLKFEP